jgi:hypothetical protein
MDYINGFQFGMMGMYANDAGRRGDLSSDSSSRALLRLSQIAVSPWSLGWWGLLGRAEHLDVGI